MPLQGFLEALFGEKKPAILDVVQSSLHAVAGVTLSPEYFVPDGLHLPLSHSPDFFRRSWSHEPPIVLPLITDALQYLSKELQDVPDYYQSGALVSILREGTSIPVRTCVLCVILR